FPYTTLFRSVDDFDIVRVSFLPAKANPPLAIDPDAPLPGALALQRLQPVRWRHTQIVQRPCPMQHHQLAQRGGLNVGRQLAAADTLPDQFRFRATEASDHPAI